MEENPYKSPESEWEIEKRPSRPDPQWLETPWVKAVLYSFIAWGGLTMLQAVIVDTFWPDVAPTLQLKRQMLPKYALLALPIGALIAWWTLRAPKSKAVFPVTLCLGLVWCVLALIGILFFDLH